MKILIVGSDKKIAIESLYARYLNVLGTETSIYPLKDMTQQRIKKSLLFRVLIRLNGYFVLNRLNVELLKTISKTKPDIVWVFKGMYVRPKTLKKIKHQALIVNYNPDHPFIFSSRGSGNINVTKSISIYNLHLCYHLGVKQKLEKDYNLKTAVLPFGFDLNADFFEELQLEREIKKVCFIGNPDKKRVDTISAIASCGFKVDIYGHGWNTTSLISKENITIFDALYGDDFWRKLRAYRVQLNIFREHNIGTHNMRTFEIPACGGVQLSPYSDEQASFFTENSEIFFYRSQNDLIDKIRQLLAEDDTAIQNYRNSARQRSLYSEYSYQNRSNQVLAIFIDLLKIN